jgi:hypothetical protein
VAGSFDHFGKTLMMIGLKGRADEIRLQGVDIVNDPDLNKVAIEALAAQPRDLRCRQNRPADRRHAALSLPDHAAQRQAATERCSRFRPR